MLLKNCNSNGPILKSLVIKGKNIYYYEIISKIRKHHRYNLGNNISEYFKFSICREIPLFLTQNEYFMSIFHVTCCEI